METLKRLFCYEKENANQVFMQSDVDKVALLRDPTSNNRIAVCYHKKPLFVSSHRTMSKCIREFSKMGYSIVARLDDYNTMVDFRRLD